jgi:hypothetical protein
VGKRLIGVVLAGALALAAGCGGGNPRLDARGFVRESSAVCARGNRSIDRIQTADPGRASARIVTIHRRSVDALRGLQPPRSFEHSAKLWIALIDQALDEVDAMRAARRAGHDAEAKAYAQKAAALDARSRAVARHHEITPCRIPDLVE